MIMISSYIITMKQTAIYVEVYDEKCRRHILFFFYTHDKEGRRHILFFFYYWTRLLYEFKLLFELRSATWLRASPPGRSARRHSMRTVRFSSHFQD